MPVHGHLVLEHLLLVQLPIKFVDGRPEQVLIRMSTCLNKKVMATGCKS
jgi:hypothetical protein